MFKTLFRFLLKNKTYSFINIFGLAAGTLCCLYILLYVQDQFSYDKQHKDARDIYRITTIWTVPGDKGNWATVTAPVAPAMKHDFAEVMDYTRIAPSLGADNHLLKYGESSIYENDAVYADSTFFNVFNFHFISGSPRNALMQPYSMVLLKSTADKLFGKTDPVGKVITMDDSYGKNEFTITGVIDESLGKSHIHANMFMSMNSGGIGGFVYGNSSWAGNNFIMSYVKLRANTNVAALEKKLPAFLKKYGEEQLKAVGMKKELHLENIAEIHTTPGFRGIEFTKTANPSFLYILLLIAIIIQVIACINFMNLSTARASKRAKEVGVRKVAGAGRADLVKQFLGESLLLSFIGVLIALPLLILVLPYLNQITSANISLAFFADYRLWLMLSGLILVTGLVAGSYPAFYLSAFHAIKVIKGNFTSHISASGIRRSLVVFQFVLSITLIAGIIIIYSQLNYIKNKDLGFDKEQKLAFSFYTGDAADKIPALTAGLKNLPEIKQISRADNYPGQPVLYDLHLFKAGGNIASAPDAAMVKADEYFMQASGIKIVAGRDFRAFDSGRIIINEALAQSLGLNVATAPGTQLYSEYNNHKKSTFEIAGVMKNYNYSSLHENVKPQFILYDKERGSELLISVNSRDYKTLLAKMEAVWHTTLPAVPFEYTFIDDAVQKQYEAEITLGRIINSFTLMAILISCLGLFGLAAFSAEQRGKEIGIRKVLGASVPNITRLLSKEFLKLIIVAFVIATPIAWWAMSQWLQAFAYRVTISWWMFAIAGVLSIFIALATVSFQAIKAAVANPVKSLKAAP